LFIVIKNKKYNRKCNCGYFGKERKNEPQITEKKCPEFMPVSVIKIADKRCNIKYSKKQFFQIGYPADRFGM
jgi:hypothetical protein